MIKNGKSDNLKSSNISDSVTAWGLDGYTVGISGGDAGVIDGAGSFADSLFNVGKVTTENGAIAYKTTDSAVLDFYASIGGMRGATPLDIISLFDKAYAESKCLTLKCLFHVRNIRGGLGERLIFRVLLKHLALSDSAIIDENLLSLVPHFGRWDDLFCLVGTDVENIVFDLIRQQWGEDIVNMSRGEGVSLLSKWLISCNVRNEADKVLATRIRKQLGLNEKKYRRVLSALRLHTKVVERAMSDNRWTEIEYSSCPSGSMLKHRNAFVRHDADGFEKFIQNVEDGKEEIKATTLYPYDIVRGLGLRLMDQWSVGDGAFWSCGSYDKVLEAQWRALPNYADNSNILVVADTSGSMLSKDGLPLYTSLGLAIYFAERNTGVYKNKFITFSSKPALVNLIGKDLKTNIENIPYECSSTNMEAVFDLILDEAVSTNASQDSMPKSIVVVTDMQFEGCVQGNHIGAERLRGKHWSFYEDIARKYAAKGYEVPNVVFWNVNESKSVYHVKSDYKGVQLVSGLSTGVFKSVVDGINLTPYDAMLKTLLSEMYASVAS